MRKCDQAQTAEDGLTMPAALTAATVKAAIRDSRAGKRWAKADGLMPGPAASRAADRSPMDGACPPQ